MSTRRDGRPVVPRGASITAVVAGFLSMTLLGLAVGTTGASAQQIVLEGRVVERVTGASVAGATVELAPRGSIITGSDGSFVIRGVVPGRYVLTVQAIGYAPRDSSLIVQADTVVIIELDPAPVQLDTIAVDARRVTVRGTVRDGLTGLRLIDVDVFGTPDRETVTDPTGRFRLNDVPTGVPLTIQVRELGYLPATVTVEPANDTTLEFHLQIDSLAARFIAEQKARLAQRSAARRHAAVPVIDRPELVRNVNRSVLDVLRQLLRLRSGRVSCIVIDETVAPLGSLLMETMLPDRLEHIEVLNFGPARSALMVRLYTRDFMQSMIGGAVQLEASDDLIRAARTGVCQ